MTTDVQQPETVVPPASDASIGTGPSVNIVWSINVPTVNRNSIKICLCFLLTIDLFLVMTTPMLGPFYIMMLVAFAILLVFSGFERKISKKLANSPSLSQDNVLLFLIYFRNIILIANVIPIIQLFGMGGVIFLGPIIIVVYGCVLVSRLIKHLRK